MISVLVLTLNEENNLSRCMDSVSWSDDIVVLDSGSTDQTQEIARAAGAKVIEREFTNEKDQREFSLREIKFKYPWVYNPDADEVTPQDLRDEMLAIAADDSRTEVAYRIRFKTMFMDRWIRYSSLYPTWAMRFFRPEKISFERSTNLAYIAEGKVGMLQSHFLHYTFNNGFNAWFDKHNTYSWYEAKESLAVLDEGRVDLSGLLSLNNSTKRRRALKELSFYFPFRPTLRFLYMYVIRLGFLDGVPGLTYCRLLAIYEYMIVLKIKEIRRRAKGAAL